MSKFEKMVNTINNFYKKAQMAAFTDMPSGGKVPTSKGSIMEFAQHMLQMLAYEKQEGDDKLGLMPDQAKLNNFKKILGDLAAGKGYKDDIWANPAGVGKTILEKVNELKASDSSLNDPALGKASAKFYQDLIERTNSFIKLNKPSGQALTFTEQDCSRLIDVMLNVEFNSKMKEFILFAKNLNDIKGAEKFAFILSKFNELADATKSPREKIVAFQNSLNDFPVALSGGADVGQNTAVVILSDGEKVGLSAEKNKFIKVVNDFIKNKDVVV